MSSIIKGVMLSVIGCPSSVETSNLRFPRPVSVSDQTVLRESTAIASFTTLLNAAKANGWTLSPSILPTANFSAMAAAAPGKFYTAAPGADPLFDDFP